MRFWLTDTVLRRVLRNTGQMGLGKSAGAIIHLLSIALTARLLDPVDFGLLMLARSFAQGLSALARCQSWQALIHFGSAEEGSPSHGELGELWGFLTLVDIVLGLAALGLGIALAYGTGELVGIADGRQYLAALYCVVVPFQVSGTPTGILRLWDRFDLMAWQSLVTPSVRLLAVALTILAGAPLWAIVIAWALSDIVGELFLWVAAVIVARARGMRTLRLAAPSAILARHRGIVSYLAATNVNATMQMGAIPFLTLLAGAALGAGTAGAFRLAQTVIDAIAVPAELAMRSLFPEIARLRAEGVDKLRQVIKRIIATAVVTAIPITALVALLAPHLLYLIAGNEYETAGGILQILSLGIVATFIVSILETSLLASGSALMPALARSGALLATVAAMFPLARAVGPAGLAFAMVLGSFVGAGVLLAACLNLLRHPVATKR